ncbi:MAG: DUF6338 family protein [Rhodospirillales bacterium]|nr:DUF6338 family protein [Rhodospirillales bacterium]
MDLSTPDAVNLALTFIVPGFVLYSTLSTFSVRRLDGGELNLVRFLTFSAMNYAVWSWLIYFFLIPGAFSAWKAAGWFWVILAGPILLGVSWAYIQRKEWVYKLLQKVGLKPIHVIPTSWDWRFSKMLMPHWILVTLKDGSIVSGWFGERSFASSNPSERDLYIEQHCCPVKRRTIPVG